MEASAAARRIACHIVKTICSGVTWLALLLLWPLPAAYAKDTPAERVQVAEPYVELHTGPGRGFPVFDVVKRGAWLELGVRRTDWYQARTEDGKQGWVSREDLAGTLTEAGTPRTLRDVVVDNYLARRLELGILTGQVEGETLVGLRVDYRLHDYFASELALTQVSSTYTASRLVSVALLSQPFPAWRISPFMQVGIGRFDDAPRRTLVDPEVTQATTGVAGVGARLYLTRRILLRMDYRNLVVLVDDDTTAAFDEWSAGLSFFF